MPLRNELQSEVNQHCTRGFGHLSSLLRDDPSAVSVELARIYACIPSRRCVGPLVRLLDADDDCVRAEAMFALATNPSVVVPTSIIAEHLRYPHFAVNAAALLCLRKRPDATARALFLDFYQGSSTQVMRIRARNTLETAWEWSYGEHKFLTRALIAVAGSIADPADPVFAEILLNVWASPEYPGMTSLAARELLSYYSTLHA